MADIRIQRSFSKPKAEIIEHLDELQAAFEKKLQLRCQRDRDDHLRFSRTGAKGQLSVGDSSLSIEVSLGFLLKPMKRTIESEINNTLDKYLGN